MVDRTSRIQIVERRNVHVQRQVLGVEPDLLVQLRRVPGVQLLVGRLIGGFAYDVGSASEDVGTVPDASDEPP